MKSIQSRSRNPFGEKIREQISSHSSIHAIQAVQELQFSWVDNPVTEVPIIQSKPSRQYRSYNPLVHTSSHSSIHAIQATQESQFSGGYNQLTGVVNRW